MGETAAQMWLLSLRFPIIDVTFITNGAEGQ